MPIELTDEITPLGSFPILNDSHLKGGWQTVLDGTARDAIGASSRKIGMVVYTTGTSQAWVLGPGITNGDWTLYTTPIAAHASSHIPGGSDALSTAAPVQGIGGGNSVGTGTSFARNDHDHKLRTTTGPTDLTIGAIADGEFLKRVGTVVVSAALAVNVAKLYPAGLNQSTVLLTTEVIAGGIYFDPTLFTTPTVTLRLVGNFTATTGSSTARLYLYDMGPGTGAFTPVRRAVATIPFANVGQQVKIDQALALQVSPGVDLNEIHDVARVYEARIYLNTADIGSTFTAAWAGLSVN